MILIKAKQLDVSTVAASLTSFFNNVANVTPRNDFVNSIKNAPGFDEKVKSSAADPTPGFLIDKVKGSDGLDPVINIDTELDTDNKIKITGTIDTSGLATQVLAALLIDQTTAATDYTIYPNTFPGKRIFILAREKSVLPENSDPDGYTYNQTTGTITFNSTVSAGERIRIFYG